jgi:sugar phosphate isomerase/epimerase
VKPRSAPRARGFQLAVENVGESYVWSGEEAGRMLKAVKDDALGLTVGSEQRGCEPARNRFPTDTSSSIPARILHVHLRDFRRNANGKVEWCAVGEGEMDNLGQIRRCWPRDTRAPGRSKRTTAARKARRTPRALR